MSLKVASAFVAVIPVLLGAANCQWSQDRYLERNVMPEELVGIWVLRSESVRDLDSVGVELGEDRTSYTIELDSDRRCALRTLLPEDIEPTGPPPAVTSSRCRWKLTQDGPHQQLSIDLLDTPRRTIRFNFTEVNGGEIVIWQYIGDPDAWRYLEYSREMTGKGS